MSRKRKQTLNFDPLERLISSSDDDSTKNKRKIITNKQEEHKCMKYYKRLDKKMDLLQRNMDVKFNYMDMMLQLILTSQNNATSFSGLQLNSYNSPPSQSPPPIIKKESTVSI